MKAVKGSIWALSKPLDYVVIPYPVGWRRDGTAVLQTGLARQAAQRYEDLELWLGDYCMRHVPHVGVVVHRPRAAASRNLVLFPVRPLNELHPQLSWNQKPSLQLIERSAKELEEMVTVGHIRPGANVLVPLVGCAAGELDEAQVLPVLEKHLGGLPRVWLVRGRRAANRRPDEDQPASEPAAEEPAATDADPAKP